MPCGLPPCKHSLRDQLRVLYCGIKAPCTNPGFCPPSPPPRHTHRPPHLSRLFPCPATSFLIALPGKRPTHPLRSPRDQALYEMRPCLLDPRHQPWRSQCPLCPFQLMLLPPGFFFFFLILTKDISIDSRERGRDRKGKREKHRLVASQTRPDRGRNPQPRHVL